MTEIKDGYYYTKTHEWVKREDDQARIGLTDYAQHQLTDIAYVELPGVGDEFEKGDELGVVESVKSSAEVMSPITGKVLEVNSELEDSPELINESPYDDGWLALLSIEDDAEIDELMTTEEYTVFVASL